MQELFGNLWNLQWQQVVMWGIGGLLIWLAIKKEMEPSLLLPMGFGAILVNLPLSGAVTQVLSTGTEVGPLDVLFDAGIANELFPLLLFVGIGAMIDFTPLLSNPKLMIFGAAAQFGIFFTLGAATLMGFELKDAASIAVIGADILILDEPTAVLTPQETEKLFAVMRNMKADGKAVVIITHKLHEVLSVSDRVAILRKGEYVGTVETATATESSLTEMMVGQKVELNINRTTPQDPTRRLAISHLSVRSPEGTNVLDDVSFDVYGGEILGIAGISGNGQKELLEAIAGLQHTESGSDVKFFAPGEEDKPMELLGKSPKDIRDAGVHLSFVPEDRLGMGLVGTMGMTDNMMLKSYGEGRSPLVDHRAPRELAEKIRKELGVVTPGLNTPVSRLSGGNVQKVLVGRELAASPIVLMTAYAVRGLDINTSYTIYNLLNEQKEKGVAVIYVGEDLDVLLELCDRILVLCGGKANGMLDARTTTKEEVGLRMTNLVQKEGK